MDRQLDIFETVANAIEPEKRFDGSCYQANDDSKRLTGQIFRVYSLMIDGKFRTLDEIHHKTGDPHASISAQLRNLRKDRFGANVINKQPRGDRGNGLWEYQLVVNQSTNGHTP